MFVISVKITGAARAFKKRDINAAKKQSYAALGRHWQKHILPGHFKNSATRKYGYEARSGERGSLAGWQGSYTAKKLRKRGHSKPLVQTGESERRAMTGRVIATSNSVKVTVPAPALNRMGPTGIPMADEVTRVTPREIELLGAVFKRKLEAILNRMEKRAQGV